MQSRQVFAQPARALRIPLHRRDVGTRRRKLRRFPAGCRAKISNAFARAWRQQPGGQHGGSVLHPELPLGKAWDFRHAGASGQAKGPTGQGFRALWRRGARLQGNIQGRRAAMRFGNAAHRRAIGSVPGRPKPWRHIQPGRVQPFQQCLPFCRHLAQNGIHQPGKGARRQIHGGCHRGMGRRAQQ